MPLAARGAVLAAALSACVLFAGCGGSVADADSRPVRATPAAPTAAANPFCTASRANSEAIGPLNTLISQGDVDRDALSRAVGNVRRTESDLLAEAPAEIRADVQQTIDAVDTQLTALLTHGGDGRAVSSDPAVAARLNSPELAAANQRLTAYLARTCGAAR